MTPRTRAGRPLTEAGRKATAPPKPLRQIEAVWSGPMANSINTRIRFAMWDALWLALSVSTGKSRDAIMRLLNEDMAKFDQYGHGDAA